jgi:TolB protein
MSLEILDLRDMSTRSLGRESGLFFVSRSWSPDGETLVFDGESTDGNHLSLFTIDVDTEEIRRLTFSEGVEAAPAWSPSGEVIAFVSSARSGRPGRHDLYLYDVSCAETPEDCAKRAKWIPLPAYEGFVGGVTWAPDATGIGLECVGEKGWNLCVYRTDTGKLLELPRGQGDVRFPNWSPDGAWIMFTEYRDVSPTQAVYAIRPDGSERIQLSGPEDEIGVGWLLVP